VHSSDNQLQRGSGQAMVEIALVLPLLLLLMLGLIQLVLIGNVALSVSQAASACARYAALSPSADQSAVNSYLQSIASPVINDAGLGALTLTPTLVPRTSGTSVTVTVSYDLSNKLFLGSSFFGVTFPTTIQITESMTSE
jgi:Flp pilus assembly protein TadG